MLYHRRKVMGLGGGSDATSATQTSTLGPEVIGHALGARMPGLIRLASCDCDLCLHAQLYTLNPTKSQTLNPKP